MRVSGHTIRHWGIRVLRRTVQVSVIGLTVGFVYLSLYAHHRATRSVEEALEEPGLRAALR